MVNPGVFIGSRFAFFVGEKADYKAGVEGGYAADALSKIQSRYFRRYPVELPLDEEPSDEFTNAVDDDKADIEQEWPDPEKLTTEEYEAELERLKKHADLLAVRKGQIKRWMRNHYMKDKDLDPKESGAINPYRVLLHRLTGVGLVKGRHRTPIEVWRKVAANREAIAAAAKDRGANKNTGVTIRGQVAKEMFDSLSEETRDEYAAIAEQENKEMDEGWEQNVKGPLSTTPADRQKCIECIPKLVGPLLDLIFEATGWKGFFMGGGPEPAAGGRIKVMGVPSGKTKGDVPMDFCAAEHIRYKHLIFPIFADFLRKCYSVADCQARALDPDESFTSLASSMVELEASGIMILEVSPRPSASPPPDINATTASTTPISGAPKTTTTTIEQRPAIHALATAPKPVETRISPKAPETQRSSDAQEARVAALPSASTSTGVVPTSNQSSSPLEGAALNSRGRNTPSQQIPSSPSPPSPRSSPPPTPPPHSLFAIPPSPLLQRSPPTSPSQISKRGDDTQLPQKRKGVTTDEVGEDLVDDAGVRPTKRLRGGKGAQTLTLPKAKTSPLSNRPRRTRASGPNQTPLTISQLASTSGATEATAVPLASASPNSSAAVGPSWFTSAVSMMRTKELGAQWIQLVKAWEAFEVKADFKESKKLCTTSRPEAVKAWIQRARAPAWRPTITDTTAYETDFKSWWATLQPKWRISSSGKVVFSRVDGDWEDIRRPGLNGLLSVMAGLFFWGMALDKGDDGQKGWKQAVSDCQVALNALS